MGDQAEEHRQYHYHCHKFTSGYTLIEDNNCKDNAR